jgi:hypothetical protein
MLPADISNPRSALLTTQQFLLMRGDWSHRLSIAVGREAGRIHGEIFGRQPNKTRNRSRGLVSRYPTTYLNKRMTVNRLGRMTPPSHEDQWFSVPIGAGTPRRYTLLTRAPAIDPVNAPAALLRALAWGHRGIG